MKFFKNITLWQGVAATVIGGIILAALGFLWLCFDVHAPTKVVSQREPSPVLQPPITTKDEVNRPSLPPYDTDTTINIKISITNAPPFGFEPDQMVDIAGEVIGLKSSACTNYAVVIYAYTENPPGQSPWFVQPTYDSPLTLIGSDSRWNNRTHLGSKYAAILVKKSYEPRRVLDALPAKSEDVLDLVIVEGTKAR